MIGGIIGDIVGSRFEFKPIKSKEFQLFTEDSRFTDDTVMTIAILDALKSGDFSENNIIDKMKYYGRKYPDRGYGGRFKKWLLSSDRETYNSFGNGSAMRVSPCAYFGNSLEEVRGLAIKSAIVTHNHPEGIKGAEAVASAIYLSRIGKSKGDIKEYIEKEFNYDLNRKLGDIRKDYHFDVTCMGSVPESIICFLEGKDFIDVIRNAISLGGDSDTMAMISGSIAECYYEVPKDVIEKAYTYLTDEIREILI